MSRKLVILGAGESGLGAALLGLQQGYSVFVSEGGNLSEAARIELEAAGIPYESGGHRADALLEADEVVKSPGIPDDAPIVRAITERGIPVISEVELAYRHKGQSRVVAITGSNGKTTTTALIHHIFRTAGLDAALVGNIGYSFARRVKEDPRPWYVAELSSFQLDDIRTFRPDVAVLTNITEDHLDRYQHRMENYVRSKMRIVMNQQPGDAFIYCADDPETARALKLQSISANQYPYTMSRTLKQGAYIMKDQMTISTGSEKFQMSVYDFALKGRHNQYNTMAAGLAASVVGIRKSRIREAVQSFEALEHRMETVLTVRGVEFINDSKATNVNSTWFALESMRKPTVLILGGVDKGNDYSMLRDLVREKVTAMVCLGLDNTPIRKAFEGLVPVIVETRSARDAVRQAFALARPGQAVLLSPACASFDLFKNYEDRGTQFKNAVREL